MNYILYLDIAILFYRNPTEMAALLCISCLRKEEEEVTELDYRHCSLDDVPNEIFAYERTLETLRLDSNNIRDLPRLAKRDITGSLTIPPVKLFGSQIN